MLHKLLLPLSVFVITGCATPLVPLSERLNLWDAHSQRAGQLTQWQTKGKIAIRIIADGVSENISANWRLHHRPDNQRIDIYGTFGSGRVLLTATPSGAILKDARGESTTADTPSDALYEKLGWRLPFAEMEYWMRGLPTKDTNIKLTDLELDPRGRLTNINEKGWLVVYSKYQNINGLQLPHTLHLRGEEDGQTFSVKIILKNWWGLIYG